MGGFTSSLCFYKVCSYLQQVISSEYGYGKLNLSPPPTPSFSDKLSLDQLLLVFDPGAIRELGVFFNFMLEVAYFY